MGNNEGLREAGLNPCFSLKERFNLTFPRCLSLERGNKLIQFFPSTFWALCLPLVMIFNAQNDRKLFVTLLAKILISGHPFSLLSL